MKRRRHILCILIIVASLFISSCGVPTICTLNNISISKISSTTDNTIEFSVKGTDSDLSLVSESCPGLLLCYVESDDFTPINASTITSAFSKTVTNKVYINDDNLILTVEDYKLYAFQADTAGTRVSTPSFSLNLHKYINYSTTMDAQLNIEYAGAQEFTVGGKSIYIHEITDIDKQQYIHVFAAFSAEQGDFTNSYWSNLVYLGYIDINPTT